MLSNLSKNLRSFLVGDKENDKSVSRKRSFDCVEDDVIATPAKKAKTDTNNGGLSLSKMADWIVNTKKTFSEKLYFRRLCESPKRIAEKLINHNSKQNKQPEDSKTVGHSTGYNFQPSFSFTDMDRNTRPTQSSDPHFKMPAVPRHNMMPSDRPPFRTAVRPGGAGGIRPSPGGGYRSIYDKTYTPHSFNHSRSRCRNKLAAHESIRLEEKKNYAQLLQQFTTAPLPGSAFGSSHIRLPHSVSSFTSGKETLLGSSVDSIGAASLDEKSSVSPVQIAPSHHLSEAPSPDITQRSYLELKQRHHRRKSDQRRSIDIEKPRTSDVSSIKAQPSLDTVVLLDDEEEEEVEGAAAAIHSPVIKSPRSPIGAKSPAAESFENSVKNCKFVTEDWIKDMSKNYSSQSRSRERHIKEEEIKLQFQKEKREEWEETLEKRLRQKLSLIAKEPPVLEDEYESEDEEEEFPELTDEMEMMIDNALQRYPPGEVLSEAFRLQITRNDMATLGGLNWLNDEIINFYMELIRHRSTEDERPSVHVFNTFFYPKVMSGGQAAVKRWTKKVDIFSMDYILIPVHLGMHWCLAVIDFRKKEIRYYDSMGGNNDRCLYALSTYLVDECKQKKNETYDTSDWNLINVKNIPQQMNGSDCGVFTCKFADYISQDKEITFSQENMPYFRRRMIYEIMNQNLL